MAPQSGQSPRTAGCKRQLLMLIPLLLFSEFVFLPLMECRQVTNSNSVQPQNGLRIDLVRKDSLLFPDITSTERVKRAVQRSQGRFEKLQIMSVVNTDRLQGGNQLTDLETPVSAGDGEFLIEAAIGTPALSFSGILDTGSDLVWTKCNPSTSSIYDPSASSTYRKVPCHSSLCQPSPTFSCSDNRDCDFAYAYGDGSRTSGIVSYETFTFSSQSFPKIAFGCALDNEGAGFEKVGGLVGFGGGPLSLVSQLGPSLGNKFSYCLVSITESAKKKSPLFLGNTASLNATTVGSTPILRTRSIPTFYYLSLEGISVNDQSLDIPPGTFDLQSDGSGGLIIDSGTTITYLPQTAYDALKNALVSSINLQQVDGSSYGLDLCFVTDGSSTSFPSVTFHFKGADFDVPKDNYLVSVGNDGGDLVLCFAMAANTSAGGISILGNIQQQNYQILYDNENNVLSFAPTACDTL
jgi:hypothetical protein